MARKTILITGSSRGIGRSIALLFASRGFHVFLNSHSSPEALEQVREEIEREGAGVCTLVPGDVGDPGDVARIFQKIKETCGHLDILVNNAGIAHIGLLTDLDNLQWDRIIRTNLSSVFYCCRAAVPGMVARKQGAIINISSMWGTSGASCEAAYSASKAGVHGLTRALAKELAPSNIPVNAVACGVIDTEMNHQLDEEERAALEEDIPLGRFGTPDEIAQIVWNVATAPSYLTGQIIGADGGYL